MNNDEQEKPQQRTTSHGSPRPATAAHEQPDGSPRPTTAMMR